METEMNQQSSFKLGWRSTYDAQLSVKEFIEWKIAISFDNLCPLMSPKFFMLGSEWRLELRSEMLHGGILYNILLCKIKEGESQQEKRLDRNFYVVTYIKSGIYHFSNLECQMIHSETINKYAMQSMAKYTTNAIKNVIVDFLSKGTFEVVCIFNVPTSDILVKPNFSMTTKKGIQADFTMPCKLESLSVDLCNLLSNETFPSDVVVRCGDHTTQAHRAILAARSKVFAAMFRNKMMESETGVVEISDMNVPDFELFLGFLYSGKIEIPSEDSASCLYAAGDKYAIPSLIKACSDYMVQNLNSENCLRFLQISERHGDEAFMGSALKFVARNLEGLKREEWFSFSAGCPKLALKVYEIHLEGTLSKQVSDKEN